MIGSRAMQADLIRNNTNILFQEGSEVYWEEMTSSIAEGYFPIKDQLSRRFSIPLNKISSHLQLPSRSLQGQCSEEQWYSSELLFKQNNMVALLEAKDVSLLDPTAVRSICKAEVSNIATLESGGLCDNYCTSASTTCLFPLSLVRVIRSYIGDSNHLPCDDLAKVYEDVQDTFTQKLLDCANELKDNLGEIGGNTTCPLEFSAMMVDKDFGVEGNSFLKYSASIFPTSSIDSLDLFNKVEELSSGDENIGIIYESRFDNFEEHAIDEAVKADLVCTFVHAKTIFVFCNLTNLSFVKFFAAGSALMVIVAIAIFTGSLWLVCIGLLQIILAIPLAYAIYRFIFGLKFFSLLNLIGFFVSAALGADDLFVAVEKFKQVRFKLGNTASTEDVAMIALPEAAFGMLLTTATTSVAFFATW